MSRRIRATDLAEEVTILEGRLHRTSDIWKRSEAHKNNDDENTIPWG